MYINEILADGEKVRGIMTKSLKSGEIMVLRENGLLTIANEVLINGEEIDATDFISKYQNAGIGDDGQFCALILSDEDMDWLGDVDLTVDHKKHHRSSPLQIFNSCIAKSDVKIFSLRELICNTNATGMFSYVKKTDTEAVAKAIYGDYHFKF